MKTTARLSRVLDFGSIDQPDIKSPVSAIKIKESAEVFRLRREHYGY